MDYMVWVAILPVILLLEYIYKKDTNREPIEMIRKIFFLGCFTVIPIVIVELLVKDIFPTDDVNDYTILFINAVFGVALIEEFFKWLVVRVKCYNNREFDETYDAIVYSVASSLGFAAVENILYVVTSGLSTGLLRAITAVPGHASFGVIMGYYFGKAKFMRIKGGDDKSNLVLSLVIPVLCHAVYDFCLFATLVEGSNSFIIVWILFTIGLFIVSFLCINKVAKNDEILSKNNNIQNTVNTTNTNTLPKYCPQCGEVVQARFCKRCGRKHY